MQNPQLPTEHIATAYMQALRELLVRLEQAQDKCENMQELRMRPDWLQREVRDRLEVACVAVAAEIIELEGFRRG